MGYSGAQGTLIYEKSLKAKISCQTPFNPSTKACVVRHFHCQTLVITPILNEVSSPPWLGAAFDKDPSTIISIRVFCRKDWGHHR